jgi:hypothetical protein
LIVKPHHPTLHVETTNSSQFLSWLLPVLRASPIPSHRQLTPSNKKYTLSTMAMVAPQVFPQPKLGTPSLIHPPKGCYLNAGKFYLCRIGEVLGNDMPEKLKMITGGGGGGVMTEAEGKDAAMAAFKTFLFPLSYVGVGIKLSQFGLTNPHSSLGALLVFWSAQMTVAKIMDGVEALMLY